MGTSKHHMRSTSYKSSVPGIQYLKKNCLIWSINPLPSSDKCLAGVFTALWESTCKHSPLKIGATAVRLAVKEEPNLCNKTRQYENHMRWIKGWKLASAGFFLMSLSYGCSCIALSALIWRAGFSLLSSPAFRLILNLISVQMHWWRIHEALHRNISSTGSLSPDPNWLARTQSDHPST